MMPSTAEDARIPVATRLTAGNWLNASATPSSTIATEISRLTSRSRVLVTGESGSSATRARSRAPRLTIARSTTRAATTATSTVAPAVITSPWSSQNDAAMGRSPEVMGTEAISAVLLDAFGTLVAMEAPGPLLSSELLRLAGLEVTEEQAATAFRAEIDY